MAFRVILEVVQGPYKGRRFAFDGHATFVVGRSRYAQCSMPEDAALSRDHFLLEIQPPAVELRDLGSTNGTFVNGKSAKHLRLHSGDVISAGAGAFALKVEGVAARPPEDEGGSGSVPTAPGSFGSAILRRLVVVCAGCGDRAPEGTDVATGSMMSPGESISWLCRRCRERAAKSPQPIPGYTLVKQLGKGSMGVVHLARHDPSGLPVALKLIIPEIAATRSAMDRFSREVDVLRQLKHPNIVEQIDHGATQGRLWFAMEYVDGPNLEAMVRDQRGEYPISRACRVIAQVLRGLEHAHALGFVHRDVKPENIMIATAPNGMRLAKLSDFGLAKCFRTVGLSGLTFSGELRGTIPFMPPEQIADFRTVLPAGDLYAAAATLYYLIAGAYPHEPPAGGDGGDLLRILLEEPPTPIQQRRPEVPSALTAVIEKCLARDPGDRYPTARAMRKALKPFCGES